MSDLQILGASWGLNVITSIINNQVDRTTQSLYIVANNNKLGGDGWYGVKKTLFVAYRYGDTGKIGVATTEEGGILAISGLSSAGTMAPPAAADQQLTVYAAAWGPADKTSYVQGMINETSQSLSFTANNQTFGDSWPGYTKSFTIVASYTGEAPFTNVVAEGSPYALRYSPHLNILTAAWGLSNVTSTVTKKVRMGTLSIEADNSLFGDGWVDVAKTLVVIYQYGTQQPQIAIAKEGTQLSFDYAETPNYQPNGDPNALNIIGAAFGPAAVTSTVNDLVKNNTLSLTANDETFVDDWYGNLKSFVLSYSWGANAPQALIKAEGSSVQLSAPTPVLRSGLATTTGMVATSGQLVV